MCAGKGKGGLGVWGVALAHIPSAVMLSEIHTTDRTGTYFRLVFHSNQVPGAGRMESLPLTHHASSPGRENGKAGLPPRTHTHQRTRAATG